MPRSSNRELATAAFLSFFSFTILGMYGAWLYKLWHNIDKETFWQRDWHCLWAAGQSVWDGTTEAVYTTDFTGDYAGVCHDGLFWLYPPYALYPASVLAVFPPLPAYIGTMVLTILACIGLCVLMGLYYPQQRQHLVLFSLGFIAASPTHSNVVLGQNSVWLTFAILGGVWGLQHRNTILTACAFAALAFKPNWLVLFILWLAFQRQFKARGVLVGIGALFGLLSVALGMGLWADFFVSSQGYGRFVLDTYPVGRLITSHAALRSFGWMDGSEFSWLWVSLQGVMLAALWVTWRSDRSLMTKAGMTVIATITCNVYTNFYDALVLVIPAAAWWFESKRYRPMQWWGVGLLLCSLWIWLWFRIIGGDYYPPTAAPVGLCLLAWALIEAHVSLRPKTHLH